MTYDFKVKQDVEVPEVVTRGGQGVSYGFPFGDILDKKNKKGTLEFYVGRDFWTGSNILDDTHIDNPRPGKKVAAGPADIRDRIKRAFTGWQAKSDTDKKLKIVCVDDVDKEGKYRGVFVYLRPKEPGANVRKKAA